MKKISTAKQLENLRLPTGKARLEVSDAKSALRIRVGRRKTVFIWTVQERSGKRRTITVGEYPAMSLADARAALVGLQAAHKGGALATGTIEVILLDYLQIKSADDTEGALKSDHLAHLRAPSKVADALLRSVLPAIGSIPTRDLAPGHIVQMVDGLKSDRGQEPARIALLYCNQVLRWAVAKGLLPRNPAADIDSKVMGVRRTESQSRDRVLSREEIAALLQHLDSSTCKLDPRTALAYRILLYTGVRSGELIQADWSEVNFMRGLWMVPGEHTKSGRPITYKLPAVVMDFFQALHAITGYQKSPGGSVLDMDRRALGRAMTRLQQPRKDGTVQWNTGETAATPHDLRRSFSSHCHGLKLASADDIERQLSHSVGSSTKRVYDRAARLKERHTLLEAWAACLADAVGSLLSDGDLLAGTGAAEMEQGGS